MPDRNPAAIENILSDLPKIQQIALRPWQQNPLLAVVLSQAQALQEIAVWAGNAHQLAQEPPQTGEAPGTSEASNGHAEMPAPADIVTPVKARGG